MNQYGQNIIITMPSKDLRKVARESLKGKWKIAVAGTFIYMAIVHVPTTILTSVFPGGFASNLYTLLVTGAFMLGYALFLLNLFRNRNYEYTQLFVGFENIMKTVRLYIYMGFFVLLWSLLFVLPGVVAAIRYSQAFYIMADHPEMSVPQVVNESKRLMRGNVWKYICLDLSFIGWDIVASLPAYMASSLISTFAMASLSNSGMLDSMLANGMPDASLILTTVYGGGLAFIFEIIILILNAGYLLVMPYRETAHIAMYDIMAGNLQPGYIYANPAAAPQTSAPSADQQPENITTESAEPVSYVPDIIEEAKREYPATSESEIIEIVEAEIVENPMDSEDENE